MAVVALAAATIATVVGSNETSCLPCPTFSVSHRTTSDGLREDFSTPSAATSWSAVEENPSLFNHKDPTSVGRVTNRDSIHPCEENCSSAFETTVKRQEVHSPMRTRGRKYARPQRHSGHEAEEGTDPGAIGGTQKQSSGLNSYVGEGVQPQHHQGIHLDPFSNASRIQDEKSSRCARSGKTVSPIDSYKESEAYHSCRVPTPIDTSAPSRSHDIHHDASYSLPTYGHDEGGEISTFHPRHSHVAVGKFQERQIRRAGSGQIHSNPTEILTTCETTRTGNLPGGVSRIEKDKSDTQCPLHSKSSSNSSGRGRLFECRHSDTHRAYPFRRSTPGSKAIHRSQPESTRIQVTNSDVPDFSQDVQPFLNATSSEYESSRDIPSFLVHSSLNISGIPQGIFSKISDAVHFKELFPIKSLPFTDEETSFLESSDPDPEIILNILMESSGTRKKIKFSVDGRRSEVRPPRVPCHYPLAPITVQRINYEKLMSLPVAPSSELTDALSWILTDRLKKEVMSHPLFEETKARFNKHVSRYIDYEMPYLHDIGVFTKRSWSPYTLQIPLFKVPKSDHCSSRLIGDMRPVNQLLPSQGPMGLPDLPSLIKNILQYRVLYQLDARSYFYAFGLGKDTSDILGVRWGNKRGRFTTSRWEVMPQGFSLAPRIAQFTSLHLSQNALHETTDSLLVPWIDNFLFGANDFEHMDILKLNFENICSTVNVDIKPPESPPGVTMDALGLHFDVSSFDIDDHFVELQSKFRDTMAANEALIGSRMTPRQYFQVFGSCMWANYAVARQPLCKWSNALGTLRQMALTIHQGDRQELWDEAVDVSLVAMQELRNMSVTLRNSRRTLRSLKDVDPDTDIFTDASKWAWGYLSTAPRLAGAHRTHSIQDIFVAELLAACDAWYTLASKVPNLHVDNTAAIGALVKGHSSTGRGNLILGRLYQCLPVNARAWVTTVPTTCQRADLLSRGVIAAGPPCGHQHVTKPVGWVIGEREGGVHFFPNTSSAAKTL